MNCPGSDEPLLGKIEMKDAVARRRVVRLLDAVQPGEVAADRRLLVVVSLAREDEMIVGDRRLPREDRVAAGNLVEGVDGERRRPVRRRQQIGVDAQRRAGTTSAVLSTRCAQTICSVDVMRRAAPDRASRCAGSSCTDARNSRRPAA